MIAVAYRNNLVSVIQHLASKGYKISTVFDIGAHKGGWFTQYLHHLPAAQFFLFEANPSLRRPEHVASHHRWFQAALSSDVTEKQFFSVNGSGDSFYKEHSAAYTTCETITLTTTTLDGMMKAHNLPMPQLIKLDVQGSEMDVLLGAGTLLDHVDVIVTEMSILPDPLSYNTGAPTLDTYMKFLIDHDYVPVGVEELHCPDNRFVQMDVVFLKKNIKIKYYGDRHHN